ncbi:MAG: ATP-binding protein [Firmicutes bacterium]|nr:ATP-binding protein [Bacillota bacterium]
MDSDESVKGEQSQKKDPQDDALSAIGQLAAGLAHEINNPLTTIKGFIYLLPGAPAEKRKHYFGLLNHEIDRIEQVTQELLALATPHAQSSQSYSLQRLMTEAVAAVQEDADRVHVNVVIRSLADAMFVCDKLQLRQVLINILENALEAMPNGGLITSTLWRDEQFAYMQVEDEGLGIPDTIQEQVGTPFFTTKEENLGLGLLICRRIIAQYGGALTISNRTQGGTAVTVSLPLDPLYPA